MKWGSTRAKSRNRLLFEAQRGEGEEEDVPVLTLGSQIQIWRAGAATGSWRRRKETLEGTPRDGDGSGQQLCRAFKEEEGGGAEAAESCGVLLRFVAEGIGAGGNAHISRSPSTWRTHSDSGPEGEGPSGRWWVPGRSRPSRRAIGGRARVGGDVPALLPPRRRKWDGMESDTRPRRLSRARAFAAGGELTHQPRLIRVRVSVARRWPSSAAGGAAGRRRPVEALPDGSPAGQGRAGQPSGERGRSAPSLSSGPTLPHGSKLMGASHGARKRSGLCSTSPASGGKIN
uniref:Uncharacterized protein n=1 Tax=Setaria viridis TaxID=4556 RepID=A0A4U6V682_SETVI|nr:hypothetical protein SEVIR_3G063600v2 [Setaria viridis]